MTHMNQKQMEYYSSAPDKSVMLAQQPVPYTYSFNEEEKTLTGLVQEKEDRIFLYEYRGKHIGTEFFISFARSSVSYKLIKVGD
jgi:hypothetical protein